MHVIFKKFKGEILVSCKIRENYVHLKISQITRKYYHVKIDKIISFDDP